MNDDNQYTPSLVMVAICILLTVAFPLVVTGDLLANLLTRAGSYRHNRCKYENMGRNNFLHSFRFLHGSFTNATRQVHTFEKKETNKITVGHQYN